jgi:hypothetical protein
MESVETIEQVYESMLINNSIIVCNSPNEMAFITDALESKSFPCTFASSVKNFDDVNISPNNVFVCTVSELLSQCFKNNLFSYKIDCVFFVGNDVFLECIKKVKEFMINNNEDNVPKFIFTV